MNIKVFQKYLAICFDEDIKPAFEGLLEFNKSVCPVCGLPLLDDGNYYPLFDSETHIECVGEGLK